MVFCPTSEQINEAVKEIDSLGAPASGSSRSSSGSSTTGTTGAQTGGGVGQPEPDAVDPAKVLAWQQYLANDGLLNLNNPNSIDNKSNASPEATGGGTGPLTGIAGQSKNDLLGQPAGPDDEQSGGGGGVSPNERRNWATNPGPDGSTSDSGKQIGGDWLSLATALHVAPTTR